MEWQTLTVDQAIEALNNMLKTDPEAISALVERRVPCNADLGAHPTVQVRLDSDGEYRVGLLGVLNGLFGVDEDGWGPIAASYDDGDLHTVIGFVRSDSVTRNK